MDIQVIGSGSSGNHVIIGGMIGIDCGLPFYRILPSIGLVKLLLLTHAHGDHFKAATLKAIYMQHPGIRVGCCKWMLNKVLATGVGQRFIDLYEPGHWYNYGKLRVCPETVPHNVPNCGYRIQIGDELCFYATDCSSLSHIEAKGYDLLAIEGNHYKDEILQRIHDKKKAGEYCYEQEAIRNHLSIEDAQEWIAANAGPNTKYVLLHQHTDRRTET